MCAAPGGKTSHLWFEFKINSFSKLSISNIMKFKESKNVDKSIEKEKGEVWAFDKNKSKFKILQKLKKEQNLENLKIFKQNATTALKDGYKKEFFDKILLDAPCSGLGLRPTFNLNNENMSKKQEDLFIFFFLRFFKRMFFLSKEIIKRSS